MNLQEINEQIDETERFIVFYEDDLKKTQMKIKLQKLLLVQLKALKCVEEKRIEHENK